ncbi:reverse transcriptase family protein [Arenibacter sp. F26102]|uniref:reverse transcriptase domain-containing protein n=1 Tax=Arenibacter sp. F26102 TaxID=2926416 RepID=UPI001FF29128|nr:reverse transcriptase domain-containing protein [Arenibacter sp. F26102]MCK0148321.1 reverse transcriptase family protein [Arenibacter sp. F26102]
MAFPFSEKSTSEPVNHSDEFLTDINNYGDNLKKNKLPVIYTLYHLCQMAEVPVKEILRVCESTRIEHYKRFKIRKKRGGFRVIQTPSDSLKYLQRWILVNILNELDSHERCFGFEKKSSILKNASVHLNQPAILKLDLQRFYDSINEKRIYGVIQSFGYHSNLSVYMAKLLTVLPNDYFFESFKKTESNLKNKLQKLNQGVLSQGAPTSPKISNLVCRRLDQRMYELAIKNGLNYSRYADDITFSGNIEVLRKVKKAAYYIINDEKFFVNYGKTKFIKAGGKFLVTGLNIENGSVTVPKKKKMEIEHHLYHCLNNGVINHLKTSKMPQRNFKDWLLGNIAFVHSIEKNVAKVYFEQFNKINWPI